MLRAPGLKGDGMSTALSPSTGQQGSCLLQHLAGAVLVAHPALGRVRARLECAPGAHHDEGDAGFRLEGRPLPARLWCVVRLIHSPALRQPGPAKLIQSVHPSVHPSVSFHTSLEPCSLSGLSLSAVIVGDSHANQKDEVEGRLGWDLGQERVWGGEACGGSGVGVVPGRTRCPATLCPSNLSL